MEQGFPRLSQFIASQIHHFEETLKVCILKMCCLLIFVLLVNNLLFQDLFMTHKAKTITTPSRWPLPGGLYVVCALSHCFLHAA